MGTSRTRFSVGGMSCSFCAGSIEKALGRTDGVEDADVSLAHEEVLVRYDDRRVDELALKTTLHELGYTIRDPDKRNRFAEQQAELDGAKRKLLVAGGASIFIAALMGWMIVGMGQFESTSLGLDVLTLAVAVGVMFGPGWYIKTKAYHSLRRGILNQHVLLEAGAFAGLLGGLLGMTVFPDFPTVHFFAVSVFITAYHILSEYTSLLVRTRASQAVADLLELRPDTARRVDDGVVEETAVDELAVGDRVRIKPGERVPVDGEVLEGASAVDESVATGESMPEEKTPGETVIGGSINETGTLLVEVTATGDDAFLNQVAREIEAARARKPSIIQLADRILKYFVPSVLLIAAVSLVFWVIVPPVSPWFGNDPSIARGAFAALAVLVLGYPCALGMATPLALIRGGGEAARRGVLMRSGDAFQIFPDIDHVVLDKTGTITAGHPSVADVVAIEGKETAVLRTAAAAEAYSEHPVASAIIEHVWARNLEYPEPESFEAVTGNGVRATVDGETVLVGKPEWLDEAGISIVEAAEEFERLRNRGLTVSGVARGGRLLGLIAVGDELKDDAAETAQRIQAAGITPVMITGDNAQTADAVAAAVGIDRVMAGVLPDEKRDEISRLQDRGHRVAMVGDGINDGPALTQADIGIAIGAGTDVAIEAADVVLLDDRLGGVMDAHEIGERSYRKTRQNLIVAFSFNGIGVAAATTGLVHPIFAMLAMVLSVSAVLANSFGGQLLSGKELRTEFEPKDADSA